MIVDFCSRYCLIICLTGWLLLLGLGISVSIDYPYNHLENSSKTEVSCYVASGLYALYPIGWFFYKYRKSRKINVQDYQRLPSEPQEIQLNEIRREEEVK